MKIMGRDWEQIQAAQQGGSLDALRQLGYDGVVDRLERSEQSDKNKRA